MLRPLDDNGEPMPGCYMQFYASQTTTPATVYADAELTTPLPNPVVSNAAGVFPAVYGDSAVVYRRLLYTAADVLVSDTDPMHPHVTFPPGTVVMFDGTAAERDAAYPPALWELMDGDNGTKDSRDRSPVGVSNTKPISGQGSTGGSTILGVTGSAGSHNHTGNTGLTVLTVAQIPPHRHHVMQDSIVSSDVWTNNDHSIAGESTAGGDTEYDLAPTTTGPWRGYSESIGGGAGHNHSISADGAHQHTLPEVNFPYFTVWFLKRRAT